MAPIRKEIDRRRFLKLGAAAFAFGSYAQGGEGKPTENTAETGGMQYRHLGNTGLKVSAVAFGAHGVDNPALMMSALEAGFNTFCTSGNYLDGREEEALGRAISMTDHPRDRLVLMTGNIVGSGTTKQWVLDSIDASLRRLRTDHLDIYCTSDVERPSDLRVDGLFEAFEAAKKAGKVSHLGLSGHHGGMQECLNAAMDDGRFEVFFTKYDFVSYPDQDQILQRAAQQGIGTMVFKTNAGNRQREIKDLEAGGLSFRQATVKWALTHPYVSSVAVQIDNFDQIRMYAAAVGSKMARAEEEMLRRYAGEMYDKYCRFCGTCEASCPRDVAVADVMRYAMYFKYYGREKGSMQLYATLPRQRSAAACDRCQGSCDAGCPFGRRVRAELVEAHRLLDFSQA
jgi:aryl-alcohol dehydrogenase-like predicted oxidoreductase